MREPSGSCFDPEVGWLHGTLFTCDVCGRTKDWADYWGDMEETFGWSICNRTSLGDALDMCDECIRDLT